MGNHKTSEVKFFGEGFSPQMPFQKKYNIFNSLYEILYGKYLKHMNSPQIIKEVEFKEIYENANIYYVFPFEDKEFISIQDKFRDRLLAIMVLCTEVVEDKGVEVETSKTKEEEINRPVKSFLDFLVSLKNKEEFAEELRNTFKTEKGKSIKIIISILVKEGILIIGSREFKMFFLALKEMFNRDIGTYQSIKDVKFDDIHKETIEPIIKNLNPLIDKYKTR